MDQRLFYTDFLLLSDEQDVCIFVRRGHYNRVYVKDNVLSRKFSLPSHEEYRETRMELCGELL